MKSEPFIPGKPSPKTDMMINFHPNRNGTLHQAGRPVLIGNSSAIAQLRRIIVCLARSPVPVLISGPAGSGKELTARAIHAVTNPPGAAFLRLDARHLPDNLMPGGRGHDMFWANNSTLFIKNISDMPVRYQENMLEISRCCLTASDHNIGQTPDNLRIILSACDDGYQAYGNSAVVPFLDPALFGQLAPVHLRIPPLRHRAEDIPKLVSYFQPRHDGRTVAQFDDQAISRLLSHAWPGNIRELRDFVHFAHQVFAGKMIGSNDVRELLNDMPPVTETGKCGKAGNFPDKTAPAFHDGKVNLKSLVENLERTHIIRALSRTEGVISQAARQLQLKRTTLVEKMRKYGLDRAV